MAFHISGSKIHDPQSPPNQPSLHWHMHVKRLLVKSKGIRFVVHGSTVIEKGFRVAHPVRKTVSICRSGHCPKGGGQSKLLPKWFVAVKLLFSQCPNWHDLIFLTLRLPNTAEYKISFIHGCQCSWMGQQNRQRFMKREAISTFHLVMDDMAWLMAHALWSLLAACWHRPAITSGDFCVLIWNIFARQLA